MSKYRCYFFVQFLFSLFFWRTEAFTVFAASPSILISEIAWMGTDVSSSDEWIELYNTTNTKIDLSGWVLESSDKNFLIQLSGEILPDGFFLLERTDDQTVPDFTASQIYSGSLNNTGLSLYLKNSSGDIIDSVLSDGAWLAGDASSRLSMARDFSDLSWRTHASDNVISSGSPYTKNIFPSVPDSTTYKIFLSEILPNPSGEESIDEFIEFYNPNDYEINLSGLILRDGSKTGKYVFDDGVVGAKGYFTIYRRDFSFALNNSGDESVQLFTPDNILISSVVFDTAHEGASYSFNGSTWQWTTHITPSAVNSFSKVSEFTVNIPDNIYVNTQADFSVSMDNTSDFKVSWDFGDKHKSYLHDPQHIYEDTGKYKVHIKVTTGFEVIEKEFSIRVVKFPQYDISITRFLPNPPGSDTDLEWIEIVNHSSKKIDLLSWSIFSGSSEEKATSHPISSNIILKPNQSLKISQKISRFSLGNTRGFIALKYPDGNNADSVSYEKASGVDDYEIYIRTGKNTWEWQYDDQIYTELENESSVSSPHGSCITSSANKEYNCSDSSDVFLQERYSLRSLKRNLFCHGLNF